jgi:hypothetical protein
LAECCTFNLSSILKSKGLCLNWTSLKDIKEVRLSDVLGEDEVVEIKTSV